MELLVSWAFEGLVFEWTGDAAWHFVRLPVDVAEEIRDALVEPPRGFGSVKVEVRIGATQWSTSVFPDGESFVLPLKKAVRHAEGVLADDVVQVELTVRAAAEGDEGQS